MSSDLCMSCRNFNIHSFSRDPLFYRGYEYATVATSAHEGCRFCSNLRADFENAEWEWKITGRNQKRRPLPRDWKDKFWVHLRLDQHFDGIQGQPADTLGALRAHTLVAILARRDMFTSGTSEVGSAAKVVRFHLIAETGSPAALSFDVVGKYPGADLTTNFQSDILRHWLQQCASHQRCKQRISGASLVQPPATPLPTRCIEKVGDVYYLRETLGEYGSYIALSHRWNDSTIRCRLTSGDRGNYDARIAGMSFDSMFMTRVFRDAIDVAEQVGVRYVWIDSLCIIQDGDNMTDWKKEAFKMADYYQQAYLSIFATSGTDENGLFPPQEQTLPNIIRLPYRDRNGIKRGHFYVYEYNSSVNTAYDSAVVKSPLFTRGWVYQEWLLSRRTVCYTPFGMFFNCTTSAPVNDRGDIVTRRAYDINNALSLKNVFVFDTRSIDSIWYRVVEGYSARELTRPEEDRMVALAGIADEFRVALGQLNLENSRPVRSLQNSLRYASGLWIRDIYYGLLWQQRNPSVGGNKRLTGLPTWSWTSIITPVYWPERRKMGIACRLVAIRLNGQDQPIRLDEGEQQPQFVSFSLEHPLSRLTFRGHLQEILVQEYFRFDNDIAIVAKTTGHQFGEYDFEKQPIYLEHEGRRSWRKVFCPLQPQRVVGWGSFEHPDFSMDEAFTAAGKIYAFHISTFYGLQSGFGLGNLNLMGTNDAYNVLFLRQTQGQQYERIGVCTLFSKEIKKQWHATGAQDIELV